MYNNHPFLFIRELSFARTSTTTYLYIYLLILLDYSYLLPVFVPISFSLPVTLTAFCEIFCPLQANVICSLQVTFIRKSLIILDFFFSRLATDLLDFNQRNNKSPVAVEEETIQISDDYSMLAASLDDLLADDISDEGFAELDSTRVTS